METHEPLLRAVQLAARKLSGTERFDKLVRDVLAICVEAVGAQGGTIYLHDASRRRLQFRHVLPEEVAERLPFGDIPDDQGVAGQVYQSRQTRIDLFDGGASDETRQAMADATGIVTQTMITVPLVIEGMDPIGVVQLINKRDGNFNENDAAVLDTVSAVSTMAYLNQKLMEENTRASSLLGMGKVGHDIGNLAASLFSNLSFISPTLDGMKEELGENDQAGLYIESLEAMLGELHVSVDRIVRYARLLSDLSAGKQLQPIYNVAPMAETIETAAAFLESEGRANGVALRYLINKDAPATAHDEMFIFRIVQNLVGNAIKAVKETLPDDWKDQFPEDGEALFGEVQIVYKFENNNHLIEVIDTGAGMAPEVAEKILAGTARSQWDKNSGSGWGTKIVLELAATHGGQVSIDSELNRGTTFRLILPHRPELEPSKA